MTRKSSGNETIALMASLLVTAGLVGGGLWWLSQRSSNQPSDQNSVLPGGPVTNGGISWGELSFTPETDQQSRQAGLDSLKRQDFTPAVNQLETWLRSHRNDPTAQIALNNARVGNQPNYELAALVSFGSDTGGALEILRGVAQAQEEANQENASQLLKVAIANDGGKAEIAQQLVKQLAQRREMLGIVGPYASDTSLAIAPIIQAQQLVTISPVSTSVKLTQISPFFFRTVPSDYIAGRALADYAITQLKTTKAVVFFTSKSSYSQSLKQEFTAALGLGGGQVLTEVDMSAANFNPAQAVEAAIKQGAEVIMLAANTDSLELAMRVVQVNRQRLKLLGGDDLYGTQTLELGGLAAQNMVVAVPWLLDASPNPEFVNSSKTLWGAEVNWRTALAYDATKVLIEAIRRTPTRTGVQTTIANGAFSVAGASGTVRFLPSGDRNGTIQLAKIIPGNRSGRGFDFVPVKSEPVKP